MSKRTRRRVGTAVAVASTALAILTAGLWWRSLFLADAADYASPATVDGLWARRRWTVLSGAGFFEVGRSIDWVTSRGDSDKFDAAAIPTGWQFVSPCDTFEDDNRWEVFTSGFLRLAWYRTAERHGSSSHAGRYLEVPYAVPFGLLLVPPATAMFRRRRRLRRERIIQPAVTTA